METCPPVYAVRQPDKAGSGGDGYLFGQEGFRYVGKVY